MSNSSRILSWKSLAVAGALSLVAASARAEPADLMSKNVAGLAGNQGGVLPLLAKKGRLVFFNSQSSNLVASDTDTKRDVYVRDRKNGTLEHLSLGDGGVDVTDDCNLFDVSENGRHVAFFTNAEGVVPGLDTNGSLLGYVHDRKTHRTVLVTADHAGNAITESLYNISLSSNGRYVAFTTDAPFVVQNVGGGKLHAYLHDVKKSTTEIVSLNSNGGVALGDSYLPKVSDNGRYVFFVSDALNLGVDTNQEYDVYRRDRVKSTTERVSLGQVGPIGQIDDGCNEYAITPNGAKIVFATSGDVLGDSGVLMGVYLRDLKHDFTSAVALVNGKAPGGMSHGGVTVDHRGRFVAFNSYFNLVSPDANGSIEDTFVADTKKRTLEIVSFDTNGGGLNDECWHAAIASDGKSVAFSTAASDVVATPTNGKRQVYVVER